MRFHGVREVLFVGEDQDDGVLHLPVVDDPVELLPGLVDPVPVGAVHHENEALGAGVVMSPEGPDLVLAPDVPHVELHILIGDGLHVEPDRGDGGDRLSQLQLVQDGSLTGGIKSKHQYSHLLVAKDLCEHFAHLVR